MSESESIENQKEQFIFPNLGKEYGEFERVAEKYSLTSARELITIARAGKLVTLSEDLWSQLENTDSYHINEDDFGQVAEFSTMVNRDWESLKDKIVAGQELDAPIVMKLQGHYHVVSGNTRLMVARAAAIRPKVLLFEV